MAKYPAAGRVKTRLARSIGDDGAAALYEAFVLDLAERLRTVAWEVVWCHWPPESPFGALVPGARCVPQAGRDLGERMATAVDEAFADGARQVVLIGADAPHLPLDRIDAALGALRGVADMVLGPALDGGYYLMGLRAPAPALFEGIAWGTRGVLADTLAQAARAGLATRLLPEDFDVDEPADLARLRTLLEGGHVRLPRTVAVLTRLRA